MEVMQVMQVMQVKTVFDLQDWHDLHNLQDKYYPLLTCLKSIFQTDFLKYLRSVKKGFLS